MQDVQCHTATVDGRRVHAHLPPSRGEGQKILVPKRRRNQILHSRTSLVPTRGLWPRRIVQDHVAAMPSRDETSLVSKYTLADAEQDGSLVHVRPAAPRAATYTTLLAIAAVLPL